MKAPVFHAHTKNAAEVAETLNQLTSARPGPEWLAELRDELKDYPTAAQLQMRKRAEDFQPGENVQYIQQHAIGSPKREDYDHGQVISIDAARQEVLVRFIGNGSKPVACKPHHLK